MSSLGSYVGAGVAGALTAVTGGALVATYGTATLGTTVGIGMFSGGFGSYGRSLAQLEIFRLMVSWRNKQK